jgi:hypothetical protein
MDEGRRQVSNDSPAPTSHRAELAELAELVSDISHLHRNQLRNQGGTERNSHPGPGGDRFRPVPVRFRLEVPV